MLFKVLSGMNKKEVKNKYRYITSDFLQKESVDDFFNYLETCEFTSEYSRERFF